ncbi:hypothetical protein ABZY93_09525 [Streptomyces smyrnaeus]
MTLFLTKDFPWIARWPHAPPAAGATLREARCGGLRDVRGGLVLVLS